VLQKCKHIYIIHRFVFYIKAQSFRNWICFRCQT